jgi:hypothetical protein
MRFASLVLITIAAALPASAALSAPTLSDPKKIVLQQADFPAGVIVTPTRSEAAGLSAYGIKDLKGANTWVTVPAGGSVKTSVGDFPKTWRVEADVLVSPSASGSKRIFGLDSSGGGPQGAPASAKVKLPSYGDEQVAFVWVTAQGARGSLIVRKQNVAWQLRVASAPAQWRATKAQALAQLKSYAAKQARRIGSGA